MKTSSRRTSRPGVATALLAAALIAACGGDDGTGPDGLRFGQIGQVRLHLVTPLLVLDAGSAGTLEQELVWRSQGPWRLEETISYEGEVGDRTVVSEGRNPESLAGEYAIWIAQINEVEGLRLLAEEVDPGVDPDCGIGWTELTLTVHDDARDQTVAWNRCVDGSLGPMVTRGAWPGHEAARVAQTAILLRDATVGTEGGGFESVYQGSLPFATLDKGEDTGANLSRSRIITDQVEWATFWRQHTGGSDEPPTVDFGRDVVLVAAVGERREAGDSVEVRTVKPLRSGTGVQIVERIPGDFCSPVSRVHTPFHIVRAPRVPMPVEFIALEPELVPCGT